MCCSLRGAAFFGASIHISFKEKVTGFSVPFMIYISLLLVLAVLIFHSIEKEFFLLLKWSTVIFFLLQVSVFVTMIVLKLSPYYRYRSFPFLPASLSRDTRSSQEDLFAHGHNSEEELRENLQSTFPSLVQQRDGKAQLLQIPEEALEDQRLTRKGNSSESRTTEWWRWRSGEEEFLSDVYRLVIVAVYGLLTVIYMIILFLYIRQLDYDDPDHVFGRAQAVTRNIAFYVQPQFTTIKDYDNKTTPHLQSTPPAQRKPVGILSQPHLQSQSTPPSARKQVGIAPAHLTPPSARKAAGNQPVQSSDRQPSSLNQSVHIVGGGGSTSALKTHKEVTIATDKKSSLAPPRLPPVPLVKEASTASHSHSYKPSTLSRGQAHSQQEPHISSTQQQQPHFSSQQPPPQRPRYSQPIFDHRHPNYIKFEQIRQQEEELQQKMLEEMREEEFTRRHFDWPGRKPTWLPVDNNTTDGLPLRQTYIQQVNGTPPSTSVSEQTSDESTYGVPGLYKRGDTQILSPVRYRASQRTSLRNKYLLPNLSYTYDYPLDSSITRWLLNRNYRSSLLSSYLPKLPSYYYSPYNYTWWPRNRSFSYTGCSNSLSSISISSILIPSNVSSPNLSYIPNQHSCFANLRRKSNNHSMV